MGADAARPRPIGSAAFPDRESSLGGGKRVFLLDLPISRLASPWLILGILSVAARADEVRWRGDYTGARAEAVRQGRPIVFVVTSKGCGWCRKLEQTTLRDGRVIRALNESMVPLKIDVDDPAYAPLVEALRVEGLPTIAALGSDGRVLASHAGYLDDVQFLRLLRRVVDESKERR
jgi:thioredoxin-related protein